MNRQKVSPNICQNNSTTRKRVAFETEVKKDIDGNAIHVPGSLLTAAPLKTAMKAGTLDCDCPHVPVSTCTLKLSFSPAPASEHHEKTKAPALPISQRRRVKSMPGGCSVSNEFFGIDPIPVRKTSLELLDMLHEDHAIGDGKLHHDSSYGVLKTTTKKMDTTTSSDSQTCAYPDGAAADVNNKQPATNVPPEKTTASNCSCIIL